MYCGVFSLFHRFSDSSSFQQKYSSDSHIVKSFVLNFYYSRPFSDEHLHHCYLEHISVNKFYNCSVFPKVQRLNIYIIQYIFQASTFIIILLNTFWLIYSLDIVWSVLHLVLLRSSWVHYSFFSLFSNSSIQLYELNANVLC